MSRRVILTAKQQDLMREMWNKRFVTKSLQTVYKSDIGFYTAIWNLKKLGFVFCDGWHEVKGRKQKRWKLTLRGEVLILMLSAARKGGEKDVE